MLKKITLFLGSFAVALVILLISIFNSSEIKYPVSKTHPQTAGEAKEVKIDYNLPHAGNILPDSPFWKLKALRDRIWLGVTTSHTRKAQLALLFADKRLVMTKILFEKGKADIALSTFTKGEKYFLLAIEEEKKARFKGMETGEFLQQLATSALKHREVAENLEDLAPEDAKPILIRTEIYAEDTYRTARDVLYSKGIEPPKNPFDWE